MDLLAASKVNAESDRRQTAIPKLNEVVGSIWAGANLCPKFGHTQKNALEDSVEGVF